MRAKGLNMSKIKVFDPSTITSKKHKDAMVSLMEDLALIVAGLPHNVVLNVLLNMTMQGVVSSDISKDKFLDVVSSLFDIYEDLEKDDA
jgi:hypothetical protein